MKRRVLFTFGSISVLAIACGSSRGTERVDAPEPRLVPASRVGPPRALAPARRSPAPAKPVVLAKTPPDGGLPDSGAERVMALEPPMPAAGDASIRTGPLNWVDENGNTITEDPSALTPSLP